MSYAVVYLVLWGCLFGTWHVGAGDQLPGEDVMTAAIVTACFAGLLTALSQFVGV